MNYHLQTVLRIIAAMMVVQMFVACSVFGDDTAGQEATTVTATPSSTAIETPELEPTTVASSTAPTVVDSTSTVITYRADGDVPAVCTKDTVMSIFNDFVRYYNAGDIDSIMGLIQEDIPDWEYSDDWVMVVSDGDEFVDFMLIEMNEGRELGFIANTPNELKKQLQARFAVGEELRLVGVSISPSQSHSPPDSGSGGGVEEWTSNRNALFGLEYDRLVAGKRWQEEAAKGVIDCESGTIILWTF